MSGKMLNFLEIQKKIASFQIGLASICAFVMMLHVSLDVILKYFFSLPMQGTFEIVSYCYMVIIFFFPLAMTELLDENISADLFFRLFPSWLKILVYISTATLASVMCLVFAYRMGQDALMAFSISDFSNGLMAIPIWPGRFVIAISFFTLAISFLVNAGLCLRNRSSRACYFSGSWK